MTLVKAIELATGAKKRYPHILDDDTLDAIQLLIHAGKRISSYRRDAFSLANCLLDGETKE